jgi:8-oxo-dGTP pyrophosphatase MutT (NUDIX family)
MPGSVDAWRRNSTTPNSLVESQQPSSAYGLRLSVDHVGRVFRGEYNSLGATHAYQEVLKMEKREGVYVILISPMGKIAVLPPMKENEGKKEAVGHARKLEDISCRFGTISGGVKVGETQPEAVIRETHEEGGFVVESKACSNSWPRYKVVQERPDKRTGERRMVVFEVSGWQVLLTAEQVSCLLDEGGRFFAPHTLLQLIQSGEITARPSYEEAIKQFVQSGSAINHA